MSAVKPSYDSGMEEMYESKRQQCKPWLTIMEEQEKGVL